jgi:hypothetical protein
MRSLLLWFCGPLHSRIFRERRLLVEEGKGLPAVVVAAVPVMMCPRGIASGSSS